MERRIESLPSVLPFSVCSVLRLTFIRADESFTIQRMIAANE